MKAIRDWVSTHKQTSIIVSVMVAIALIATCVAIIMPKAVEHGDETLKGDAGKEIVNKLTDNVAANPNASDETKEKAEETSETEAANEPAAEPAQPTDNGSSNNNSSSNGNSGNNSNGNSGNSNSGNSGNSGNAQPSQPAHTHNWVTTYKTVTKTRTVVDSPARTERVVTGEKYIFDDGYTTTSTSDAMAYSYSHSDQHFSIIEIYETRNIPAVTHEETYTEQVANGHKCTGCGATK